jgi:hypothetical protein
VSDEREHSSFHEFCRQDQDYQIAVYDSQLAEDWLEAHFYHSFVKRIRQEVGGPFACMLSFCTEALCIFGDISSDKVITLGQSLANLSNFPVMVRRRNDDPSKYMWVIQFLQCIDFHKALVQNACHSWRQWQLVPKLYGPRSGSFSK